MGQFAHTGDGDIYCAGFPMTLAEFEGALAEPAYTTPSPYEGLPDSNTSRYYSNAGWVFHTLSDGSTQTSGPIPWVAGDEYITNGAAIQASVEAVRAAAADPPSTDDEYAEQILNEPFVSSWIAALAPMLPGPPSAATLRANIKTELLTRL